LAGFTGFPSSPAKVPASSQVHVKGVPPNHKKLQTLCVRFSTAVLMQIRLLQNCLA
jgi:hypothetical protein